MTGGEYQRGHAAGGIEERLAGHDKHFAAINGQLKRIADEMVGMRLEIQRQGDRADSSAKTVVATALALEKAENERRDRASDTWSPFAKVLSVIVGLSALAAIIGAVLANQ